MTVAGAIVGAVVGGVVGTRHKSHHHPEDVPGNNPYLNESSQYPDYKRLNYRLVDDYMGPEFFDQFDYFTGDDPTKGYVDYVDRQTASDLNLTYTTDDSVILKADTVNLPTTRGRQSVRIESKAQYDHGLFIFDIAHTPYGCGLWPALWLADTTHHPWHGEIDIVETDNFATDGNVVTLHTWEGCSMEGIQRNQTGKTTQFTNCGDGDAAGCSVRGHPESYGELINDAGGGVYALELRDAGIRTWFFSRGEVPEHNSSPGSVPDPSRWKTPLADFPSTRCDILSHFSNQSIIVNIDLCGEQGGKWGEDAMKYICPEMCGDIMTSHPEELSEAFWEFKGFKVYQTG